MNKKIFSLVVFLFFYFTTVSFAQNSKIDSLYFLLKTDKEDTNKVYRLNNLLWEFINTGNYDTALHYGNTALKLAQQLHFQKGIANSYSNIGVVYSKQGEYSKTLDYYFKALEIYNKISYKIGISKCLGNIAIIYKDQGDYSKALEYSFNSLKIDEEIDRKTGIGSNLSTIGVIYWKQGDYTKALEYDFKALKLYEEISSPFGIAVNLCNIGLIYWNQKNHAFALEYYFKALKILEEIGNKYGLTTTLGNVGIIYYELNNEPKALEYYLKALKIGEEIGDKLGVARHFGNIGMLYSRQNKIEVAERYLLQSLSIAQEIGSLDDVKDSHKNLSELYFKKGDYKKAFTEHQQYSFTKDSIFSVENSRQIHEMSTKYETEKKEQQIKLLNKDKEIQAKDLERQKTIRNAVAGGLLLVIVFSFVLTNRLLLIRKQKKLIEIEREKSEKLLLNILPKETADELKHKNTVTPKHYEMVSVMFTDFKGFTTIAEKMSAEELVSELDFIFKKFDEIISKYPIEKIKTIGDAYMCAGGLPVANTTNPMDVVLAGLEICEFMKSRQVVAAVSSEERKLHSATATTYWQIRIGLHTGSVIAGVVGDKKFAYDIWGDTVNTASRMESSGEAGKVNISGATYKLLVGAENLLPIRFTYRGKIPAKNKGEIEMYFVDRSS